jgi:hypothetical protein
LTTTSYTTSSNIAFFYIFKDRLWVYRNESAIWPVSLVNVTETPGFPLQLVVGTKPFGVTQGTWSWWGTMLHYDHGAEWQMFFLCPMPYMTGIFLYTAPYVLTTSAGCIYSAPSQVCPYSLRVVNVLQRSTTILMHDWKSCIICPVYVLTVYKLLRLFLGMNCPVYAFHEHRNTEQAEESHRHSNRFLQVCQRRHFVCDLIVCQKKLSSRVSQDSHKCWQHVSVSSSCK